MQVPRDRRTTDRTKCARIPCLLLETVERRLPPRRIRATAGVPQLSSRLGQDVQVLSSLGVRSSLSNTHLCEVVRAVCGERLHIGEREPGERAEQEGAKGMPEPAILGDATDVQFFKGWLRCKIRTTSTDKRPWEPCLLLIIHVLQTLPGPINMTARVHNAAFAAVGEDKEADVEEGMTERYVLDVERIPIPRYDGCEIFKGAPILRWNAVRVPESSILGDATDMQFFGVFNLPDPAGDTHKRAYRHGSRCLHFLPGAPKNPGVTVIAEAARMPELPVGPNPTEVESYITHVCHSFRKPSLTIEVLLYRCFPIRKTRTLKFFRC